jgi:hypothetical protein
MQIEDAPGGARALSYNRPRVSVVVSSFPDFTFTRETQTRLIEQLGVSPGKLHCSPAIILVIVHTHKFLGAKEFSLKSNKIEEKEHQETRRPRR